MLKFVIVFLDSERLKKLHSGRNFMIIFPIQLQKYKGVILYLFSLQKIFKYISTCGSWLDYENFYPIVILSIFWENKQTTPNSSIDKM